MPLAELDGFALVYTMTVDARSIDDNGHVNVAHYSMFCEDAATAWHPNFGMTAEYKQTMGGSFFASESHMRYFREALQGGRIDVYGRVSELSAKAMLTDLLMVDPDTRELIAGQEMLFVHVDIATRRPSPMREPLAGLLKALVARQPECVSPLPYKRAIQSCRDLSDRLAGLVAAGNLAPVLQ